MSEVDPPGWLRDGVHRVPGAAEPVAAADELGDPFRLELPTLLVANKCDQQTDPTEVAVLEELLDVEFPALRVSAQTGEGLDEFEIMVVLAGAAAFIHPCDDRPTHAEVQVVSFGEDHHLLLDCEVRYRQLPRRAVASVPGAGGSTR